MLATCQTSQRVVSRGKVYHWGEKGYIPKGDSTFLNCPVPALGQCHTHAIFRATTGMCLSHTPEDSAI